MKCFLWIYSLAHTCNRRRVWWSLVTQTSLTISPQLTSTLGSSSRVSDSTVPTFISASLIRSWTSVETCVHFSNKTDFISPLSLLSLVFFFFLQLYSSVDFGRKWQLIHEHVTPNRFYWWVILFHISAPTLTPFLFLFLFCLGFFFFSNSFLQRFVYSGMQKVLIVFRATEQVILMAENNVSDWLLKILHVSASWCNQAKINLLLQNSEAEGHVAHTVHKLLLWH